LHGAGVVLALAAVCHDVSSVGIFPATRELKASRAQIADPRDNIEREQNGIKSLPAEEPELQSEIALVKRRQSRSTMLSPDRSAAGLTGCAWGPGHHGVQRTQRPVMS
jgi:hypothetical protein